MNLYLASKEKGHAIAVNIKANNLIEALRLLKKHVKKPEDYTIIHYGSIEPTDHDS
jgi:hypothetical protein